MLTKDRPLESLDRKLFAKGVTPAVRPESPQTPILLSWVAGLGDQLRYIGGGVTE